MTVDKKSVWQELADQISSPWDWVAVGLGSAAGAGFTLASHGSDLGTSIATGATSGFALRKALVSSLKRKHLKVRGKALTKFIETDASFLIDKWLFEVQLFNQRIISNEEFELKIVNFTENLRNNMNNYRNTTLIVNEP